MMMDGFKSIFSSLNFIASIPATCKEESNLTSCDFQKKKAVKALRCSQESPLCKLKSFNVIMFELDGVSYTFKI